MTEPIRKLSPQLIFSHPALGEFYKSVESQSGFRPRPDEIKIYDNYDENLQPIADGILNLGYTSPDGKAFAGRLDASQGSLTLNQGRMTAGLPKFNPANSFSRKSLGVCTTVRHLGESGFTDDPCIDLFDTGTRFKKRLREYGNAFLLGGLGFGMLNMLPKKWAIPRMARGIATEAIGGFRLIPGRSSLPMESEVIGITELLGGLAMLGTYYYLPDILSFDRRSHAHELFAFSALAGYGTHRLAGMMMTTGGLRINRLGFGSRLFSSALVDATVGQFFTEGSHKRYAVRTVGFFAPQIVQYLVHRFAGGRTLAFTQSSSLKWISKWGGRAMLAGFAADALYMTLNYWENGAASSARINNLYNWAWELHNQKRDSITALFYGAAELVAPALAKRYLTPDTHVHEAQEQIKILSSYLSRRAKFILQQGFLSDHYSRDQKLDFYRRIDMSWLRGENLLKTIRRDDGKKLLTRIIFEKLSDSTQFHEEIERGGESAAVRYIIENFPEYRLNEENAQEILAHINVYYLRQEIAELYQLRDPSEEPLLRYFDRDGRLKSGSEEKLLRFLFPEMKNPETQILELRRNELMIKLQQPQSFANDEQRRAAQNIAQELGLTHPDGTPKSSHINESKAPISEFSWNGVDFQPFLGSPMPLMRRIHGE